MLQELEKLSDTAVDLIFNNKINAKNAFDVNVDFLERLPHILDKHEETSWQKASASLDASAKIYGFRVDSVHSETFKFLGGLNRADNLSSINEENEDNPEIERKNKKNKNLPNSYDGSSTLEKDIKKLDLIKYDLEFDVDPLFKAMTAKFSETGAKGLILENLPLDSNLDVLLEADQKLNFFESEKQNKKKKFTDSAMKKKQKESEAEIFEILEKTLLSNFSIKDSCVIPLSKEINYFKKSREIETNLEKTFYQKFINQFENSINNELNLDEEENIIFEEEENEISIYDENEAIEHLDFPGDNNSMLSVNSNFDGNSNPSNNDITTNPFNGTLIFNNSNNGNNLNVSNNNFLEGVSHLKTEDLKSYLDSFGEGNKDIINLGMNDFKNFSRKLDSIDNWKFTNLDPFKKKNDFNNLNKNPKQKKVQMLFDFSEENEINEEEFEGLFESKESKVKKLKEIYNTNNANLIKESYKKKRCIKKFYNFGIRVCTNLFSIPERSFKGFSREINEINNQNIINNEININQENIDYGAQDDQGEFTLNNEENVDLPSKTFVKLENEYEKKFGRLYKTFDVRFVKNKIWDSMNKISENKEKSRNEETLNNSSSSLDEDFSLTFNDIMNELKKTLSKEILDNISNETCFVCLLHLANEKNLDLKEIENGRNFQIKYNNKNLLKISE